MTDRELGLTTTPLPAIRTPQMIVQTTDKEWVGLTKEDLETIHQELFDMSGWSFNTMARAVEAKLKEKNT